MAEHAARDENAAAPVPPRFSDLAQAVRVLVAAPIRRTRRHVGAVLRPLFDTPAMQRLKASGRRLVEAGTAGYPPDVRRRLKILNVICYLIATTNLLYAVQQAATDFTTYAPMVYMNLVLVATVLMVPLAHRLNDVAGGILLVVVEYVALVGFASFFGREGGAHLQYFIAAAAAFVIFGLRRLWLIGAVVLVGLVLHLYVWNTFPNVTPLSPDAQAVIDSLYTQGAITTVVLIAASVYYAFSLAEQAKAETDAVLRNVLPDAIVERLKAQPGALIADSIEEASVMFADISGFVALSRRLGATATVDMLSRLVSEFDALAAQHGVEKIKTIGDAYMVVGGLPEPVPDHAARLARMGLDMLATAARYRRQGGHDINLRIGMAAGPVTAGVIGTRKFSYDVWGDPVNLASRLEGQSTPGRILICPTCRVRLGEGFHYEPRGPVEIKGIGPLETYYLVGVRSAEPLPVDIDVETALTPSARPRSRSAS